MVLSKVFAYILLFVIKCRFPSSKSVADIIRNRYDENTLQKIRKLEKLDFKIRKCKLDMEYLQICIDNKLRPKFLNFKVANHSLRSSKAYLECQVKLLKQELSNKKSQQRIQVKEQTRLKDELVRIITLVDFTHLISLFAKSNDAMLSKCQQRHKKKLYNLGYFEKDKDINDPDQVIHNHSSYTLSDVEKSLLAKGLNFALPPQRIDLANYLTPFELLYKEVKGNSILARHELDLLKVDMKKIAYSSFKKYNFLKELNLCREEYQALKNLSSNKDIVIQKSDKGNSVVIVNRDDYIKKMQEMVDDESKFEKVKVKEGKDYNFMVKEKATVDKILADLVKKKSIDEDQRKRLSPDGPTPARLYGSPKIHKPLVDGLPKYRPIISQIGSSTYKLAKFLLDFVKPHTTNEYTVKDTFHFVSMLDSKNHHFVMASLDVESLFTNIPLTETIEIVCEKVFDGKETVNGISKVDFRKLLIQSTKGTVFYFNGRYYRQKDGVAMGSPLGPALANAFLCHHEGRWLEDCPLSFAPVFYARYVDDIFVLLRSREHIIRLANYFSEQHPKIKFTYELEENNCLPFLDVNVYREGNTITSSVHRKDTFSGVFTNYESFLPEVYKKGLVATLLYRAYRITSSHSSLHDEVEKLKNIFKNNGYPMKFVDRCIFRFFNKIYEKRTPTPNVPKKEITMVLPFLGVSSFHVRRKLTETFNELLPCCKLKTVFKTARRMSSFFNYKDKFPSSLTSGVIYKYTCACCKVSYIGSTRRYWEKRLEEHTHISALTGGPLCGLQVFAPLQHVKTAQCNPEGPKISRDDFEIIGRESDRYLLLVKESLLIKQYNPKLNANISCIPLHLFA